MNLEFLQQHHVEITNINHRMILLVRRSYSQHRNYSMLNSDNSSMLLLLLIVCLGSLVKKRAELFRLSTCCCCQPAISLTGGAGSEGLSLTVYEYERKRKAASCVLPSVCHLFDSVGITAYIHPVKFQ